MNTLLVLRESRNRLRSDGTIESPTSLRSFGGMLSGPAKRVLDKWFIFSLWFSGVFGSKNVTVARCIPDQADFLSSLNVMARQRPEKLIYLKLSEKLPKSEYFVLCTSFLGNNHNLTDMLCPHWSPTLKTSYSSNLILFCFVFFFKND